MGLPWVRLDANIATHDKMLALLADPSPQKWQAAASYMFALAWSGGQGTDGRIPLSALGFVHGSTKTARLLEKYRLWKPTVSPGWEVVNYGERQQLNVVSDAIRAAQSVGGKRGNCIKYHGDLCWKNGHCRREEAS